VSGNHRHGQAGRSRALELAVVLDDPDNQKNEAAEMVIIQVNKAAMLI
jgi:hypothetical protein